MVLVYSITTLFLLLFGTDSNSVNYSFEHDQSDATYSKKDVKKIVQEVLDKKKAENKSKEKAKMIRRRFGYALIGTYLVLEGLQYVLTSDEKKNALDRLSSSLYNIIYNKINNRDPLWHNIPKMPYVLSKVKTSSDTANKLLGMWVVIEGINFFIGDNGLLSFKLINNFIKKVS